MQTIITVLMYQLFIQISSVLLFFIVSVVQKHKITSKDVIIVFNVNIGIFLFAVILSFIFVGLIIFSF